MTRLEYFKKLPLQKRLQAMENVRKQKEDLYFSEIINIETNVPLTGAFNFEDTKQGHDYWMGINYKYFD